MGLNGRSDQQASRRAVDEERILMNAVERAYWKIRDGILSGKLTPNARLKEIELVEFCGVSRTPVREALRRLAADDFVSIQRNHGAQVKSWSKEYLDDLFDLRALLEGYAARRAARRITEAGLKRIRVAIEQMDDILATNVSHKKKVGEFLRLNRELHEAIWEASGSERLKSMLGSLVEQALMVRTVKYFTIERITTSHHHHKEVLQALEVGDEVWAESIMSSHIRAARGVLRMAMRVGPGNSAETVEDQELANAMNDNGANLRKIK